MQNSLINQEIEVTSLAFQNRNREEGLEAYPKRMVWDDREYTFTELGMRLLVRKGQELIKLFDMSDGQNQYRLRLDEANHWTLVGMKATA
jgi:hypothetical protein